MQPGEVVRGDDEKVIAVKAFAAALLLVCCGLGPGLLVVRRLRGWWPLERLCAAVGISLFVVYLAASAIYGLGWPPQAQYGVTAICLVLLATSARDLYAMLANVRARRALLWYGVLVAWCLVGLSIIRHYSGGGWHGDWLEHFQRCLFFHYRQPLHEKFIGIYELPARPPLMNLLGAFVMAQVGTEFAVYQVVFLLLNSLIFLPCALLASSLARRGGRHVALVAVLFALNPMFVQNVTYSWTKLLGGFYAMLGVCFYLRALRKGDTLRLVLAVGFLAAGVLVHYSAAVYVLALAAHYLVFAVWTRRHKWRELLLGGATGATIMATWLAWSIQAYGWRATFASNTAVTSAGQFTALGNVEKVGSNLFHSLLPHPLFRIAAKEVLLDPRDALSYWRDYTFLIYQTNIIIAMGSIGGILIVGMLVASMLRKDTPGPQRKFWLTFALLSLVGGVAVVGEKDYFGLAHICLQPAVLLGVTFLAVSLPSLRLVGRCVLAIGAAFDFAVGVLLQLSMENTTVQDIVVQHGRMIIALDALPLNKVGQSNLALKIVNNLEFWGDSPASLFQLVLAVGCLVMLGWVIMAGLRKPLVGASGGGQAPTDTTSGSAATTPTA